MVRFNPWYSYNKTHNQYSQDELNFLMDTYEDDFRMYDLMGKMLDALSDKILHIERNNTVYDIPICNIDSIYLTSDDVTVDFVDNGYYYEHDVVSGRMCVFSADSLEVKRPKLEIIG